MNKEKEEEFDKWVRELEIEKNKQQWKKIKSTLRFCIGYHIGLTSAIVISGLNSPTVNLTEELKGAGLGCLTFYIIAGVLIMRWRKKHELAE